MEHSPPERLWRRREEELTWREIEDEVIVLDLRNARYIRFNATSGVLWDRLDGGATLADLAERLVKTYAIATDRALVDAEAFVRSCERNDLLRPADE
jgi:Coenzyme PQQ synthesis protein D (PqqD)